MASTIANARVDGELLSDVDTASYYTIIATAGHDTTSATIAGGLEALLEHPDQLARLRENPGLMPLAVDEMIRWVTPVKEFMRTATADTEIRGVPITEGESVLLSYPSGNRDEDIFTDPFTFDIARDPNKHLAFGFGVHFCLGRRWPGWRSTASSRRCCLAWSLSRSTETSSGRLPSSSVASSTYRSATPCDSGVSVEARGSVRRHFD